MARGTGQRWLVGLLTGLLVMGGGSVAGAAEETISGRSSDRGVEITVERFSPGQRVLVGGGSGRGSGAACSLFPWIFDPGTAKGGIPPTPEHRRFIVSCDGRAVGTRWIGPADPLAAAAARAVEIAAIAQRVLREIPVGDIGVGRRPRGRAVTGVPVYLWVAGYDGRPIERTVHELGVTVDVRIALSSVTWDFGDGTRPRLGGLGEPWPRRSSVRHSYGTTSTQAHPFTVTAGLTFSAEYRVDGGPWHPLAPISREASAAIDVDEVQAVRRR